MGRQMRWENGRGTWDGEIDEECGGVRIDLLDLRSLSSWDEALNWRAREKRERE